MANYLVNHQKKLRIFAKREREFLHALKHQYPTTKFRKAAEKLRAAKINVFKSLFAKTCTSSPSTFSAEEYAKKNAELERWLAMSDEEIALLYQSQATMNLPDSSAPG